MIAALWLASALAGGPRPIELEGVFENAPVDAPAPILPWWHDIGSPELVSLIEEALVSNQALGAAFERVSQARNVTAGSAGALVPSASFDVTTRGQPLSNVSFCAVGTPDFLNPPQSDLCWQGSALLNLSWQVDVSGRLILTERASHYDKLAAEGDRSAQALSVSQAIAVAWLDAATAREQLLMLERQRAAQGALLESIEIRWRSGAAAALDVLQQRQAVATSTAQIPTARATYEGRRLQLSALLGRAPGSPPVVEAEVPDPRPLPATGLPADLLDRRPDLVAARQRIRSADARHSATVRALLPSLRLTAAAGWNYALADELNTIAGWQLGGTLSIPLFNAAAVPAERQGAAAADTAVYTFNQAALDAVRDVESALVQDQQNRERHAAVLSQAAAAKASYDEATGRYLAGLESFTTVLTSQNAWQAAEISALFAHRDALVSRISLHVALGGELPKELPAPGDPR